MAFDIISTILNLASDLLRIASLIVTDFKEKVIEALNPKLIPIRSHFKITSRVKLELERLLGLLSWSSGSVLRF